MLLRSIDAMAQILGRLMSLFFGRVSTEASSRSHDNVTYQPRKRDVTHEQMDGFGWLKAAYLEY